MPVSTDGVLLGAWVDINQGESILDIGTGTGLLALMCAQRFSQAIISAVEIDSDAFQAAKNNFSRSTWCSRLSLYQQDILLWSSKRTFDCIVCNPPYFNSGEQSKSQQRAKARHTDTLTHQQLLIRCKDLLSNNGTASFILPTEEAENMIAMAISGGWQIKRVCRVQTSPNKPVTRLLFELSKQKCQRIDSELIIQNSGDYSSDFIALTKEFYLKM